MALTTAQTLFEASLQNSTSNRRQTHANLQDKLNNLIVDIRLYDKGLKVTINLYSLCYYESNIFGINTK